MSETRDDRIASLFESLETETPDRIRDKAHELAGQLSGKGSPMPLAAGDLAGPYEIVGVLGSGGQAVVYEARHATLGRRVALKVPRKDVGDRLVREAKLLATLTHPSIVQVFDLSLDGPVPYLVLELCEGWSLEERLDVVAPDGLPLEQVHAVATSVLEALAYAHEQGVVHRDVKPSNILFDKDHRVKVSDFGIGSIARADELSHSAELSQLSILAGTPLYVAPEQENPSLRENGKLDGRADLFSFGKVLFQMLTGASPRTIRPASRLRPGLDAAWDEYVFRLTEERPGRRPHTARVALFELPPVPRKLAPAGPRAPGGPKGPPDAGEPGTPPDAGAGAGHTPGSGRTWIGPFRVEQELGRRLGLLVFRCRDESQRKSVLVHVAARNSTPDFMKHFFVQAEKARAVTHPGVLRVRELHRPEGESPFTVLDDFDGRTMAAGTVHWREAVRIILRVAHALGQVHLAGIFLDDVSFRRILVGEGGTVRLVIDAPSGVAAAGSTGALAGDLLAEGRSLSPERLSLQQSSAPSDLYSLGTTFYRLVMGQEPLAQAGATELASGIAHQNVPPPGPWLPPAVVRVLGKLLEPDPTRRYATALDLVADLIAVEADTPVGAGAPSLWPGILETLSTPDAVTIQKIPADAPRIGSMRLGRVVAQDSMSKTLEAFHDGLGKVVHVRVLDPETAANPRTVERFLREARAATAIQHPNVRRTLDCGITPEKLVWVALEASSGRSLREVIDERGKLPWREATDLVLGVARGLGAAHGGVVHRDLKPEAIHVGARTEVTQVSGFGFAKDLNSDMKLTASGAMIGTPLYMAPEIGRVKETDGRVDIYSLGVIYYELLTGVQPFRRFSAIEILSAKAHDQLDPPEKHEPALPAPVRRVLGKMLSKDRDQRYPTAASLALELEALLAGRPVRAGEPKLWSSPLRARRAERPTVDVATVPSREVHVLATATGLVWVQLFFLAAFGAALVAILAPTWVAAFPAFVSLYAFVRAARWNGVINHDGRLDARVWSSLREKSLLENLRWLATFTPSTYLLALGATFGAALACEDGVRAIPMLSPDVHMPRALVPTAIAYGVTWVLLLPLQLAAVYAAEKLHPPARGWAGLRRLLAFVPAVTTFVSSVIGLVALFGFFFGPRGIEALEVSSLRFALELTALHAGGILAALVVLVSLPRLTKLQRASAS